MGYINYMNEEEKLEELQGKIEALRIMWRNTTDSRKKAIYELQARPLKSALNIYYKRHPNLTKTSTQDTIVLSDS
jgi:hypothetical protein